MKSIILLIGLGLFLLVGAVGCEEGHEHHSHDGYGGAYHGGYGGAYDGYYHGYGHDTYHDWDDHH